MRESKLPDNISPLHSHWEYKNALRVMHALQSEGNDVHREFTKQDYKELQELKIRIEHFSNLHFPTID